MQKLLELGGFVYYRFTRPEDVNRFKVSDFDFFKGFGIIDYQETFKAWMRKFPRPVFLAATYNKRIAAWIYVDEWKEGYTSDGNSVYVLRAIETEPKLRRKRIGTRLVALGLKNTVGYMIVKPVSDRAETFFRRNGFLPPGEIPNLAMDLSKHPGYYALTLVRKKQVLERFEKMTVTQLPIFVESEPASEPKPVYDNEEVPESPVAGGIEPTMFVYYNGSHVTHVSPTSSPERPLRVEAIYDFLSNKVDLFRGNITHSDQAIKLTKKDLNRAHTKRYVDFVEAYSNKGGGFLGDDTYFTGTTYDVAMDAACGATECVKRVVDHEFEFSFGIVRPPGHHAGADKHAGFCIFNNAAVAALYALHNDKAKRVMILDWDAHAANGTQDIFYSDPNVLVVSIHQEPKGFYPNTGFAKQMGKGPGLGYNVNIEMPKGSGDDEYRMVMSEIVEPLMMSFKPDLYIGCCGFDAYYRDRLTALNLTAKGYYDMATFLGTRAIGKLAVLLEGGYHNYCDKLTYTFINGLIGRRLPYIESVDPLLLSAVGEEKVRKRLLDNLKELRFVLEDYHDL